MHPVSVFFGTLNNVTQVLKQHGVKIISTSSLTLRHLQVVVKIRKAYPSLKILHRICKKAKISERVALCSNNHAANMLVPMHHVSHEINQAYGNLSYWLRRFLLNSTRTCATTSQPGVYGCFESAQSPS